MSCDSVATHMLQSLHTHMDCESSPQGSKLRWSGSPGQCRGLSGESEGAAWHGGTASISGLPSCAEVTCSVLRWSQAENCPFWHELHRPFGTMRRANPSTISTIHLQLSVICSLLLHIWHWVLLPPAARCSRVSGHLLKMEIIGSGVTIRRRCSGLFLHP